MDAQTNDAGTWNWWDVAEWVGTKTGDYINTAPLSQPVGFRFAGNHIVRFADQQMAVATTSERFGRGLVRFSGNVIRKVALPVAGIIAIQDIGNGYIRGGGQGALSAAGATASTFAGGWAGAEAGALAGAALGSAVPIIGTGIGGLVGGIAGGLLGSTYLAPWIKSAGSWIVGHPPDVSNQAPQETPSVTTRQVAEAPPRTLPSLPPVRPPRASLKSGEVRFANDSSELDAASQEEIHREADAMKAAGVTHVAKVEGHTDGVGSDAYNQALSERRTEAVKAELEKSGITVDNAAGVGSMGSKSGVNDSTARRVNIMPAM